MPVIEYSDRDWREDWAGENGQYICRCSQCQQTFIGYKRRVICKACAYTGLEAEAQALREEVAAASEREGVLEHRLMRVMTQHFAEAWRKRETEKTLEGYLSAGIAELEGERDAALAEVAALRARVVVPERKNPWRDQYRCDPIDHGFNLCLDELARLNGKAVSEGLLRRIASDPSRGAAYADLAELRALLGEGKEHE